MFICISIILSLFILSISKFLLINLKKSWIYLSYVFSVYGIILILFLSYVENILFFWNFFFEENFILKNTNEWVRSLYKISFNISFLFWVIYFFLYSYFSISKFLFFFEILKTKWIFFCILYYFWLAFFLLQDFGTYNIILLEKNKNFFFEFQPELENFILFLINLLFDFFFTSGFFILSLFIFVRTKSIYLYFQQKIIIVFWVWYWFCGEGFLHDLSLISILLGFSEFLRIWNYFYLYLSKIKFSY